jgi:hypothetical protein
MACGHAVRDDMLELARRHSDPMQHLIAPTRSLRHKGHWLMLAHMVSYVLYVLGSHLVRV